MLRLRNQTAWLIDPVELDEAEYPVKLDEAVHPVKLD